MARQSSLLDQDAALNYRDRLSIVRAAQNRIRRPVLAPRRCENDRRHIPDPLDRHRTFSQDDGVCMKPILVALLLLSSQIEARLHQLRKLSDAERIKVTRELALDIRRLPATPKKEALAEQLANLVTEGDPGHD